TRVQQQHSRQLEQSRVLHAADWDAIAIQWRTGLDRVFSEVDEINLESSRLFPSWTDPVWNEWQPPDSVPPIIRFGDFAVDMGLIPHGVPSHNRFSNNGRARFSLPALLPFSRSGSMLFHASGAGRALA